MTSISNSSESLKSHCAQIIDQFERKRCQKKRKDVSYFFYKILYKNILLYMNTLTKGGKGERAV